MLLGSLTDRVGEWVVSLDTIGQMSSSAKGNWSFCQFDTGILLDPLTFLYASPSTIAWDGP